MNFRYLLILLVCCAFSAAGRQYTTADKLPANTVYCCVRDSKGYLWMGTEGGVVRFDGRNFKTFTVLDGLGDNEVFNFFEDREHRLWLFTYNGTLCYFKNDTVFNATNDATLRKFNALSYLMTMFEDEDGSLYFGYKKGLVIRLQNNVVDTVFTGPSRFELLDVIYRENGLLRIACTQSDYTFVKGKLSVVASATQRITYVQNDYRFVMDQDLLKVYDKGKLTAAYRHPDLTKPAFLTIYRNDQGDLFCGTMHGLLIIDHQSGAIRELFHNIRVTGINQDIYGNYWITTLGNGIFGLNEEFYHMRLIYNGKGSIYKAQEQVLFVQDNKLYTYPDKGLPPIPYSNDIDPLLALSNGYIFRYADGNCSFIDKNDKKTPLSSWSHYPKFVYKTRQDSIIFVYMVNGSGTQIVKGKIAGNRFLVSDSAFFPARPLASHYDVQHNKLYLISNNCLLEYDGQTAKLDIRDSFAHVKATDIFCLGDKIIVPVSNGSYFIYGDQKNTIPKSIRMDMITYAAYNLKSGRSIVRSNKGFLLSMPLKAGQLLPEFRKIEYPFNNAEINDLYPINDSLLCNINNELYLFDESLLNKKLHRPPLIIEKLVAGGHEYRKQDIRIHNSSRCNIRITLGTFYFNQPDHAYQYQVISGNDSGHWYTVRDGNTIELLLTRYGSYKILLRAVSDNNISSEVMTVHLTLAAPFYYRWWFLALIALCIAALVLYIIWLYNRRRKKIFENELNYLHLEYKSVNSLLNPHFIFNAINNIQSLINDDKGEKANEYLYLLSKLIRQNIQNLQFTLIPLDKELSLVQHYIYLQNLRFNNCIGFTIHNNLPDTASIQIPPLLIHTFIENAIVHGYRKDIAGFMIDVDINITADDYLIIRVTDNGQGYEKASRREKAVIDKTSLGIDSIKKRLERLSRFYKVTYQLSITDLAEKGGRGTEVMVILYARFAALISK